MAAKHAAVKPVATIIEPTAPASPPPFTAELGFTRVRPPINWPKSDKSDFGWRDREGACSKAHACVPPPPQPSPASGGGSRPSVRRGSAPALLSFPRKREPIITGRWHMGPRFRGDDGERRRVGKGANRSARSAAGAPCPRARKNDNVIACRVSATLGRETRGQRRLRRCPPYSSATSSHPCPFLSQACWWCRWSRRWRRPCAPADSPTPARA